jgi:hypothetical protein
MTDQRAVVRLHDMHTDGNGPDDAGLLAAIESAVATAAAGGHPPELQTVNDGVREAVSGHLTAR